MSVCLSCQAHLLLSAFGNALLPEHLLNIIREYMLCLATFSALKVGMHTHYNTKLSLSQCLLKQYPCRLKPQKVEKLLMLTIWDLHFFCSDRLKQLHNFLKCAKVYLFPSIVEAMAASLSKFLPHGLEISCKIITFYTFWISNLKKTIHHWSKCKWREWLTFKLPKLY